MECPGDLAWICLGFPALLPVIAGLFMAGETVVLAEHSHWRTGFGPMELVAIERQVAGRYPDHDGVLLGRLSDEGGHLSAVWLQPTSERACDVPPDTLSEDELELVGLMGIEGEPRHWGRAEFALTENGTGLDGRWSYCDAEPAANRRWTGERLSHEARRIQMPE